MSTLSSVSVSFNHLISLDIIQGEDSLDSNCVDFSKIGRIRSLDRVTNRALEAPNILKGLRVGVLDEFNIEELDDRNRSLQKQTLLMLKERGAVLVRVSVPLMKYMLPFYFSLVPSEAATNLARFDGLKYGHQPDFKKSEDILDYVERVRTESFGLNVKRRVILGNFLLSSKFEHFNEKVRHA